MMDVTSLYTNIYHVDEVDTCSRLPNHPKLSTLSKTHYVTNDGCLSTLSKTLYEFTYQ